MLLAIHGSMPGLKALGYVLLCMERTFGKTRTKLGTERQWERSRWKCTSTFLKDCWKKVQKLIKCIKFQNFIFPYTVPYLYPTTNIMMTCSIYMTAAVGVNRYLDIIDFSPRVRNGFVQAAIVLFLATAVNIPRWWEFEFVHVNSVSKSCSVEKIWIIFKPQEMIKQHAANHKRWFSRMSQQINASFSFQNISKKMQPFLPFFLLTSA